MTTISQRLREATAVAHRQAESATFIDDLLSGRLDADQYGRLAAQLYFVYRALEEVGTVLAGDPIAGAVLDDRLRRTERLRSDLVALGIDPQTITPLPAVERYVAAIEATINEPARYIAHHYTRYLGDLSGGQVVAHRMREHYGLDASTLSFYSFDGIDKLKRYKDAYRDRIDALDIDESGVDNLVAEAISAFELNQELFADLDAARVGARPA
ncbi:MULTISPECIES: biliverdin-producing heme oxygenase [unclassified Gordonia (in: high G+C Gram-positive bacteria)]|uniref:biliverdin-producing heme oxygenase n=1 Tax=unclassified Gordonia (in: high G+C Gram-positive bacteria) TaxID=2657482 RepID=UPI0007EB103A|nr:MULTISPECIES: biliverdin-producing heme oxygenase [unclassified Gordonia (in: high G+C Gram-positive bacteria)]OBC00790.1 heme oxygenase [Gordonia sp. 852002-50395_SCH5434458]OBC14947.1 heme oxygenase [Gordonia sp. 852002-50816_SCH5313054-c]OBC21050.1 heme oxygenase [Gordonia sp. 852002-50816_SCH5313054-a]